MGQTSTKPLPMSALVGEREQARRERAAVTPMVTAPQAQAPVVPSPSAGLVGPDDAVGVVAAVAPVLFVEMVEKRRGLLHALKAVGVSSATFFTALDASQDLRNWYRGVKGAQAVMDVEMVDDVLGQMEEAADDSAMGNGERNAKMALARTKLEQARWAAQKLLPALYGEKVETHSKVEIVVRRETKKAKAASEE